MRDDDGLDQGGVAEEMGTKYILKMEPVGFPDESAGSQGGH